MHFAKQYELFPKEEDSQKESSVKAGVRFIVSLIALKFFIDIGFYFNLISGSVKGLLGALAYKNNKTFSDFNYHNFGQDVKRHFVFMVVDLATVIFVQYFYFLFTFWPLELEQFMLKLKGIIYRDYPLGEIGMLY